MRAPGKEAANGPATFNYSDYLTPITSCNRHDPRVSAGMEQLQDIK